MKILVQKTVKRICLTGGKRLLAGILAAGLLITCGCNGDGKTERAENGNYGWNAEMDKVQAAGSEGPDVEDKVQAAGSEIPAVEGNESREMLVYILEYDGKIMTCDEVEWVSIPSARADELNLTDEGSGFEIYNEKKSSEQIPLSENCVCTVLDWSDNFLPTEITPQELAELLAERDAPYIPYILTIENGKIASVQEHYVP